MVYRKGSVFTAAEDGRVRDTTLEDYDECVESAAYLPHSCGEWVIGGPKKIKALIKDLQLVLNGKYVRGPDET